MTLADIRNNVRNNLADNQITFYSEDDINQSIQDGYFDIAAKSFCINQTYTLSWLNNKNYYDFVSLKVPNYMGTIAIFNLNTNFWLEDSISLRDLDRLRYDWELWVGQPQFWAPHSYQYTVIAPKFLIGCGQFILLYWCAAPTLAGDYDVPLIATDMQVLLEDYATADLLDGAEEVTKAANFWKPYSTQLAMYKERCTNLAKSDILLRV